MFLPKDENIYLFNDKQYDNYLSKLDNVKTDNDNLKNVLKNVYIEDISKGKNLMEILKVMNVTDESLKGIFNTHDNCEKFILENDLFLKCIDCVENGLSCYCRKCFIAENHINHETTIMKIYGICKNVFDGYFNKIDESKKIMDLVESIDKSLILHIQKATIRAMYAFIYKKIEFGLANSEEAKENLDEVFEGFIEFLKMGFKNGPLIVPIIAEALNIKFQIPQADVKKIEDSPIAQDKPITIIELFLANISDIGDYSVKLMLELWPQFLFFDNFADNFTKSMLENIIFFFDFEEESRTDINIQFRTSTALTRAVNKCAVDGSVTKVLEDFKLKIDSDELSDLQFKENAQEVAPSICQLFDYYFCLFQEKDFALKFMENDMNLKRLIDLIYSFQYYFPQDCSKEEYLQMEIQVQSLLFAIQYPQISIFMNLQKYINIEKNRRSLLIKIGKEIAACLEKWVENSFLIKENDLSLNSTILPIQRCFTAIIIAISAFEYDTTKNKVVYKNLTIESLEQTFNDIFDNKTEYWKELLFKGCIEIVHQYGFTREIARKFWNKFGEEEMDEISQEYNTYSLTSYDLDSIYLQLVFLFCSKENIATQYTKFSSQTDFKLLFNMSKEFLKTFSENEDNEKILKQLPDYFTMFNIVTVNDFSIANIITDLADPADIKNFLNDGIIEDYMIPYSNFIKNQFYALGSSNSERLRKLMLNFININFPALRLAKQVQDYDEKTGIFRLKPEDQEIIERSFNPIYFYKNEAVLAEITENLFDKSKHKDYFSCEIESPYFDYLKNLAPRIINDTIMDFVLLISDIKYANDQIGSIIKPILNFSNILFSYINKFSNQQQLESFDKYHNLYSDLDSIKFFLDNHFANYADEFICVQPSMKEGLASFKDQIEQVKRSKLICYLSGQLSDM